MQVDKRTLLRALAAAPLTLAFGGAFANEEYPGKPTRIIVPYTPGGFNDTLARTVSDRLNRTWKHSVMVDNRPGGNTVLGNNLAA